MCSCPKKNDTMNFPVASGEPQRSERDSYPSGTSPGRYQFLIRENTAEGFCSEGVRLSRNKRHEEALEWFDRALRRDPRHVNAWVGKGFALGKLGRYDEEIQCCDRVLELDPESIDACC
jgi:tetratricopeptide (TPR) repeat protein